MKTELEIILSKVIPEHIRDENPVVSEMFRIFLEYIGETSYDKVQNLSALVDVIDIRDKSQASDFSFKKVKPDASLILFGVERIFHKKVKFIINPFFCFFN